jgi:hypothetical protein
MLKCKIFSGSEISKVEDDINIFLQKFRPIDIHSISQSSADEKIFISVFYNVKTKKEKIKEVALIEEVKTILTDGNTTSLPN